MAGVDLGSFNYSSTRPLHPSPLFGLQDPADVETSCGSPERLFLRFETHLFVLHGHCTPRENFYDMLRTRKNDVPTWI
ncbi:hypothetical protein K443DRAFT_673930 [Laccaria amethystina LaAM-08-1]|uniref:Unplaced genomic scaffold K443scaffold_15, whole genome shotgun sequence n=1 Tax=Laccaria amethystina LaAM-08-1 TaxID=1095629 RepID=A0A0C9WUA5_9AGAR|nr:hypothetical protein K443DRAFT_685522 [Laccaria amethystina LaAM-08-1]KIK07033.1 hypothetical protein K443DRAFT_673930 [Laccaria amethystina LaAM-08-1]